jgi:hypothetical protein
LSGASHGARGSYNLTRRAARCSENRPVHYRCNAPADAARCARAYPSCEFVSFSRVGQCNYYHPRLVHRLADRLDRRAIRLGKPGVLLAIRAVK